MFKIIHTYLGLQYMSNCHQMAIIRLLSSTLQIQSVFLDFWNKKQTENINQTIIFNCILISLWLFIVIITFFKQLLTIISFVFLFYNNNLLYLLIFFVTFNHVVPTIVGLQEIQIGLDS